jgi:hypothetical protein
MNHSETNRTNSTSRPRSDTSSSLGQATGDRASQSARDMPSSLGQAVPGGQTSRPFSDMAMSLGSAKIRPCHHQRLALVYVRQSTLQQVLEHKESTARQYALVEQAVALGWSRGQVEVIDEDQGQSGQSAVARQGFQRLLTAVALNQVVVLCLEDDRT